MHFRFSVLSVPGRFGVVPEPRSPDITLRLVPTEEMMMDTEEGGGPGYSDETFINHPKPGMHYVAPPAPTHASVFLPKKTPEQLKAQAASVASRLAAAKAASKA
nr:hypothetical protein [Tanacetum cinerariifolium]